MDLYDYTSKFKVLIAREKKAEVDFHTNEIKTSIISYCMGTKIFEKHFMLKNDKTCVDFPVSLDFTKFNQMRLEMENIENIIENLDQIRSNYRGGEKLVDNISQNIKDLKLFKTLTTLRKDVEIPKKIEMYELQNINEKKLDEFSKLHNLNINIAK